MQRLAVLAVLLTATYLLCLGGSALVWPDRTRRFLGAFAQTLSAHALELTLRIVAGVALVTNAPQMLWSRALLVFGWALIGTSVALALVPWRLHQRFARWVVPQVSSQLPVIGVTSAVGGLLLLGALLLPRAAS